MAQKPAEEMGVNAYLVKQLEAKDKKIKHLEFLLEQRSEETENTFREDQKKINRCEDDVKEFFIRNPGVGFTYLEARHDFKALFNYEQINIDRRMRQLAVDGFLWKSDKEDGQIRYYLKLEELPK